MASIIYKTKDEIEIMRQSALLASKTLGMLASEVRPGISSLYLDKLAYEFIKDHHAKPAFLGLYDFPNTLCISINEQVVHGIPTNRILKDGDIISTDVGVMLNGFVGDQAYTFEVGEVSPEVKQLLKVTKESLEIGIQQVKKGNRIGDIGHAIQTYCEKRGYGVVRELFGHGLGRTMHEKPEVPNFGKRGSGPPILEGLVIAIEPMINMGRKNVKTLSDKWTVVSIDGKPSAHYEHNVAVINGLPDVLTTFSYVEEALKLNTILA